MRCVTILGLMLPVLSGCHIIEPIETPQGHYYLNPDGEVASVSRVILLELENQSTQTELADQLTRSLADGLSKRHLFAVRTVYRSDELWTALNLDNITAYSYEDLASISQSLKADAVVFGTIKRYTSYPHMLLALHLKMVNVRNGELIWAIEEVWDSTDKNVELRMKRYFTNEMRTGYQPLNWELLITSPRAFNKFVVYEVISTLPELSDKAVKMVPDEREDKFLKSQEENSIKTAKIN
jgi:TolB-like protein